MSEPQDVIFKSLSDPTRRALFERLCRDGEQTVAALTLQAGISQPAVSEHLAVLKQAGLVNLRHEGRQTHYAAQLDALAPGARGNVGDALNLGEAGSIGADLFVTADRATIGRTFGYGGSIYLPGTGGLSLPFAVVP